MQYTRVHTHFFGPFVGSHREPHQNRLKLICNLRHVWPARYISSDWPTEKERRAGGFHPVIVSTFLPPAWPTQGPENWNTYQTRKEIWANYNARYSPAIAGNSLILITRAIMYKDYRVARTSLNSRHHICIVRCSKHNVTTSLMTSPFFRVVIKNFYIHRLFQD